MNRIVVAALVCAGLGAAGPALGQSINIAFGPSPSAPSAWYGAAGAPGVWNAVGFLPAGQRQNLVGLRGQATTARVYQIGASSVLSHNNPATGAGSEHEALLDDMLASTNSPVDACVWVEGLANGPYEVLIYAITPNDPNRYCRTRVDFADQGETWIGGPWNGAHAEGESYSRFTVQVTSGLIGLHSGLWAANYFSGLNGFQVRNLNECAADFDGSGSETIADIFSMIAAWFGGAPWADIDRDHALGVGDIFAFLGVWFAGC